MLHGMQYGALGEDGSLAIAAGASLQTLADDGNVNESPLIEFMIDDEIPGCSDGEQALAAFRSDDAVRKRLVMVIREDVGVEISRLVVHRPRRGRLRRVRGLALVDGRRGSQYLIFRRHLLETPPQLLILYRCLLLCGFETGDLGFQILDVLLLPFPKRPLAAHTE